MKLTAQSKKIIRDNKHQEFYLDAVNYLESEHSSVLRHHEIKQEALFSLLQKNYNHFESVGRPSQYLCVTQTSLMLYCGQFYNSSPLYQTIKKHLDQVIFAKNPTSKIWLTEIIKRYRIQDLSSHTNEVIEYAKNRYLAIGESRSLLKSEIDLFLLKDIGKRFTNSKEMDVFLQQANECINSMVIRRDNIVFLCIVAQYLDGLNCFNDILRPKWFDQLQLSGLISWSFGLPS